MNIYSLLKLVRKKQPMVHHLTNWVTIYDCAQVVKSFGASPVMAHASEESGEMAKLAASLVLNIGTLTPELIDSMKIAVKSANQKGIPVVLDVCGAGATPLRDEKSFELINQGRIDIIKGNASEIARISGESIQTKGVDSGTVDKDLIDIACSLAKERKCTVVITGEEDIVANSEKHRVIQNGCEMMSYVVGTGCMAASVIGTFAAVCTDDLLEAVVAGLCCYEIAAELAEKKSTGPGIFKINLFDCIYQLNESQITSMQRVK